MGEPLEVKITMLGKQGVGKTSLSQRFHSDTFQAHVPPTIGASFMAKTIEVGTAKVKLYIWDTAGTERFQSLSPMYIRSGHIVFICFDEPDLKSITEKIKVTMENNQFAKIFLVATKQDLIQDIFAYDVIKEYATSQGYPLYYTSSLTYNGIHKLFLDAAVEGQLVAESMARRKGQVVKIFADEPVSTQGWCCYNSWPYWSTQKTG